MRLSRRIAAATAATVAAGSVAFALPASASSAAAAKPLGNKSLAKVLLSDGNRFDANKGDFDVVTELVLSTLKKYPKSDVGVLTDGSVKLTAFVPTDAAFGRLVTALTGKAPKTERATYRAVWGLGAKTVQNVLLYHVVPGATITSAQAVKADGATLDTALSGATFTVKVRTSPTSITLVDNAPARPNPRVILSKVDINKGNKQIAHGINRVLLPVAL